MLISKYNADYAREQYITVLTKAQVALVKNYSEMDLENVRLSKAIWEDVEKMYRQIQAAIDELQRIIFE